MKASTKKTFTEAAVRASAQVYDVQNMDQALAKALEILAAKAPLVPQTKTAQPTSGPILAAPDLSDTAFDRLNTLCREQGISLIRDNLRQFPQGIDMGITHARYGIAETGTIVVESDDEEVRLASMLSEFHLAILSPSEIGESALDMADQLAELTANPASYTAFITGPSRTADIERVLAIGVHGPLELHIVLVEEE